MRLAYIAQFRVPVVVEGKMNARRGDFIVGHKVEDPLADDGDAVADAQDFTLDHGGYHQPEDAVEGNFGLVEHFRNDDHGIMAGSANAEGQVAGFAAHGRNHKPVAAGARIFINGGCQPHPFLFGTLVAEGRNTVGQGQVVVDGFRNVDVLNLHVIGGKEFRYAVGGGSGIVATDGDQQLHIVADEKIRIEISIFGFVPAHNQE